MTKKKEAIPLTPEQKELVGKHYHRVKIIIDISLRNLPRNLKLSDLHGAAVLGLIAAAQNFDPLKEVLFQTYADDKIRYAIKEYLREQDPLGRATRTALNKLLSHTVELGRNPSPKEFQQATGLSDKMTNWAFEASLISHVPLSTERNDPAVGEIPDGRHCPEQTLIDSQHNEQLRIALAQLKAFDPRMYDVVVAYYGLGANDEKGQTLREIGVALDLHESRISQILKDARTKLLDILRELREPVPEVPGTLVAHGQVDQARSVRPNVGLARE